MRTDTRMLLGDLDLASVYIATAMIANLSLHVQIHGLCVRFLYTQGLGDSCSAVV